jgi:kynurenine formamidase
MPSCPRDIKGALKKQGNMKIEPGDVVIFHTGWMSLWMKDNKKFASGEPGLGIEASEWLAKQGVAMVGADTWGVEVIPFQYKGRVFEPHQILITKAGIYILENLVTEHLAKDKVYEFLFVLTHPRTKGTPQAITAPLAIR